MLNSKPKGFGLIELLIVIAIVLIIAAIAIPNFVRSKTYFTITTPQGTFTDTGCYTSQGAVHCEHGTYAGSVILREYRKGGQ